MLAILRIIIMGVGEGNFDLGLDGAGDGGGRIVETAGSGEVGHRMRTQAMRRRRCSRRGNCGVRARDGGKN